MRVRVWLASVPGKIMRVLVVFVVPVAMVVCDGIMLVGMLVVLADVQPDSERHEAGCEPEQHAWVLSQNYNGRTGADKGRKREVCTSAGCADPAQRQHVQHEAKPVTGNSNNDSASDSDVGWQRTAAEQPDADIHGTRDQPFGASDLHRVARRNLARQIVIKRPRQACANDRKHAQCAATRSAGGPCQQRAGDQDRNHAEGDAPVEIFLEHEPREQRREDVLEVQQQ